MKSGIGTPPLCTTLVCSTTLIFMISENMIGVEGILTNKQVIPVPVLHDHHNTLILDPFCGEFWRYLSYLDPFHVYLDPFHVYYAHPDW